VLLELTVRDLGVIDDLTLLFEPGMTVLTGETGAGKTLLVEAIELLDRVEPDLMLLDRQMPRLGGVEAVQETRRERLPGRSFEHLRQGVDQPHPVGDRDGRLVLQAVTRAHLADLTVHGPILPRPHRASSKWPTEPNAW